MSIYFLVEDMYNNIYNIIMELKNIKLRLICLLIAIQVLSQVNGQVFLLQNLISSEESS